MCLSFGLQVKSEAELNIMADAADISAEAFVTAMELSYPGVNEGVIDSVLEHSCRLRGSPFLAYPPVVAGGSRANIIHYILNDKVSSHRRRGVSFAL